MNKEAIPLIGVFTGTPTHPPLYAEFKVNGEEEPRELIDHDDRFLYPSLGSITTAQILGDQVRIEVLTENGVPLFAA